MDVSSLSKSLLVTTPNREDEELRRKRKAQGLKACHPCRQRKVKCSYESPCQTCRERGHPDLCTYPPPSKRIRIEPSPSSPQDQTETTWLPSKAEWDRLSANLENVQQSVNRVEQSLVEMRRELRLSAPDGGLRANVSPTETPDPTTSLDTASQGIHTRNSLTGETVYLGGNSIPAMVFALSGSSTEDVTAVQELLGKSVLPVFGLDNESATYPFVDLWGMPHGSTMRVEGLCKLLPSDADCLQFFRSYRDTAHVLFPGIVDIQTFESDITLFLIARASNQGVLTEQDVYGRNLHWLGLFFACLASGCQCSSLPRKERQLTSQVYVCCAYECLRIINYLSCSQLEDIQNLLLLGNVISNGMNAGVAWNMLGLTIRLAQSLGLHRACPPNTPSYERIMREDVWARVIWQDSLLSITYDRASSAPTISHHRPFRPSDVVGACYIECMQQLCKIALDIVRERTTSLGVHRDLLRIEERRQEILEVASRASQHLRDASACRSMKDHLEHWNWYMHRSYVMSELCRQSLRSNGQGSDLIAIIKATCIDALADTVDAFLSLQNLTVFAKQSWAALHRSLSSALLLGILKEPARNPRVRLLLERLISVMSSFTSTVDPSEMSAPITRAISAITKLNSIGATRRRSGSLASEPSFSEGLQLSNISSPLVDSADRSDNESPHALMSRILWGSRGHSLS